MLPFAESFLAWAASTAIPALIGILLIALAGSRASSRAVAAFALGIFFWFFVDTINGSADLDVTLGFNGGVDQVAMVLLFVVGILLFFSLDRSLFSEEEGSMGIGFALPLLAAIAVGIHGFGEGTAFGSTASLTSSGDLLDAFGGTSAGVAYALHKMFEPMMVGALYVAYAKGHSESTGRRLGEILTLMVLFVLPSLVGAATGYFISYDATYGFALGTGTSIFVAFRLEKQAFKQGGMSTNSEWLKMAIALIAGFLLIYFAALFHS